MRFRRPLESEEAAKEYARDPEAWDQDWGEAGDTVPSVPPSSSSPMRELGLDCGVRVGDNYRIERCLGGGGMGVVTLAYDERLDRQVAIKFIRPELFAHEDLRAYFQNEARAMARVTHPNVLAVHAFGEHEGIPYFVMEYVDGPTVEGWLAARRGEETDLDDALHIVQQACQGVSAMHAASTVHRDLKPSNLLIGSSLHVAVSDLGVARILEGSGARKSCLLVGSPGYMAPEAALGDDSKPELATRRDVYALGCITYELLTGQPPFRAPTEMGLMAKHVLEIPAPPSSSRPEVEVYDDAVLRALDKDPRRRFDSVDEFLASLTRTRLGEDDPRSILVVDDDDDWRSVMEVALGERFPRTDIEGARSGAEALMSFERRPHAVVLADLAMPEVDGLELTRRLRALPSTERTPIIVITAAGGPSEWRRLSELGADGFLVKPVDPDDVAMLVRRTLRARRGFSGAVSSRPGKWA